MRVHAMLLSCGLLLMTVFMMMTNVQAAESLGLQEVIDKLQARYEGIQDLESDFTQITQFKGFTTTLTSKGKFYVKKGKLRWDYYEPSKQQIFVEEDQVLFYVPEHQQVIKSRLSADLDSQVPVRLLAGSSHLDKDFNIRWRDESAHQNTEGAYLLTLSSKTQTPHFTEIQIDVDPKDFLIRRIVLQEPEGNGSTFEFGRIKTNHGLRDRLFQFDIPKGVAVVEQP